MFRGSRAEKVAEWTNRLRRFEESGQTVADFCVGEGVSQPSFYHWKKKFRESGMTTAVPGKASNGFRPVMVTPSTLPAARQSSMNRNMHKTFCVNLNMIFTSLVESVMATAPFPPELPYGKKAG